ncbi:MAG: mechanosensitive ion channel family protein, partial [Caulobacter sp.]
MQTNAPKEVEQAVRNPITLDENLVRKAVDMFGSFAVNLLVAVLILAVTFWLAKTLSGVVRRALTQVQRHHPDPTLASFGASLTRYLVIFVGIIAVLQQLGVQTTSILAVLGAASLAVGLALQGTLS